MTYINQADPRHNGIHQRRRTRSVEATRLCRGSVAEPGMVMDDDGEPIGRVYSAAEVCDEIAMAVMSNSRSMR